MTPRPPAGRPSGAARFNPPVQPPSRARSRLSAVGATIVLLGLVGGVPAVLLLLAGPVQIPTRWPDQASLTGQIGIEQVLSVLVVVVWLAWLQFLVCVAVEVLAALRGGVLARPVPAARPDGRPPVAPAPGGAGSRASRPGGTTRRPGGAARRPTPVAASAPPGALEAFVLPAARPLADA